MTLILLVIQIILSICLIIIVLLQKNSGEEWSGLASSSSSGGFISKKAASNFLTKATIFLATLFMFNGIVLANLVAKQSKVGVLFEGKKSSANEAKKHHKYEDLDQKTVPLAE